MCTEQPFREKLQRASEETGKLLEKDVTDPISKHFTTNKSSIVVAVPFLNFVIIFNFNHKVRSAMARKDVLPQKVVVVVVGAVCS